MRVPQVSERIKEAPAQALRGVFAGIGQLLLITDKLRNKTPAGQQVPRARAPESAPARPQEAPPAVPPAAAAPAAQAPPAPSAPPTPPAPRARPAEKAPEARDFDKTGNVRLLTGHKAAASTAPTVDATVTAAEEAVVTEEASPAAEAGPGAPMTNYDESSIASVRARLRNLDVTQLRELISYERAHADRADFITMFERRIAKLQAETTPEARGAAAKVYRGEAEAEAEIEAREDVEAEVGQEIGTEAEGEE